MILVGLIGVLFDVCTFVLSLLGTVATAFGAYGDSFLTYVGYGIYFFGIDSFSLVMSTITTYIGLDLTWAVAKWVYKKLPGVD